MKPNTVYYVHFFFLPEITRTQSTVPTLNLKPTHKPVKADYAALDQFAAARRRARERGAGGFPGAAGALPAAVQVGRWCRKLGCSRGGAGGLWWTARLVDDFRLMYGFWEAKDDDDDLPTEVERKFAAGAIRYSQTQREEGTR